MSSRFHNRATTTPCSQIDVSLTAGKLYFHHRPHQDRPIPPIAAVQGQQRVLLSHGEESDDENGTIRIATRAASHFRAHLHPGRIPVSYTHLTLPTILRV